MDLGELSPSLLTLNELMPTLSPSPPLPPPGFLTPNPRLGGAIAHAACLPLLPKRV